MKKILSGIPCGSQAEVEAMAMKQVPNETAGDATDISYSLNMAHSHASILFQQADYWKKRCQQYQDALAEIEAMAEKSSPIEMVAAKALGRPSLNNKTMEAK
jgi:hypothetical protein